MSPPHRRCVPGGGRREHPERHRSGTLPRTKGRSLCLIEGPVGTGTGGQRRTLVLLEPRPVERDELRDALALVCSRELARGEDGRCRGGGGHDDGRWWSKERRIQRSTPVLGVQRDEDGPKHRPTHTPTLLLNCHLRLPRQPYLHDGHL